MQFHPRNKLKSCRAFLEQIPSIPKQELKRVMQIEQLENSEISIYGKTGMGKAHGIVVDAWFTGFAENSRRKETIYFCVHLGQSDNKNFSSTTAKEIAIQLITKYWTY